MDAGLIITQCIPVSEHHRNRMNIYNSYVLMINNNKMKSEKKNANAKHLTRFSEPAFE